MRRATLARKAATAGPTPPAQDASPRTGSDHQLAIGPRRAPRNAAPGFRDPSHQGTPHTPDPPFNSCGQTSRRVPSSTSTSASSGVNQGSSGSGARSPKDNTNARNPSTLSPPRHAIPVGVTVRSAIPGSSAASKIAPAGSPRSIADSAMPSARRPASALSFEAGSGGPTSTTPPARRPGRSKPATRAFAVAAAPTRSRATARATPTRTAGRATPARSSAAGRATGCWTPCARGARGTAGCHRPTTGHARTHAGAASRRSSGWLEENGRLRAWS
jgi:hypothetical protein